MEKWRSSVIYWAFAVGLLAAALMFGEPRGKPPIVLDLPVRFGIPLYFGICFLIRLGWRRWTESEPQAEARSHGVRGARHSPDARPPTSSRMPLSPYTSGRQARPPGRPTALPTAPMGVPPAETPPYVPQAPTYRTAPQEAFIAKHGETGFTAAQNNGTAPR